MKFFDIVYDDHGKWCAYDIHNSSVICEYSSCQECIEMALALGYTLI